MVVPLMNSLTLQPVVEILDSIASRREVDWALGKVDINRRLIGGQPVFLPLDAEAKLAEALSRRLGERHLGALVGQRYDYSELSWYGEFVLTARTLGEALLRAAKALPVLHPGCRVSLEFADGCYLLLFHSGISHVVGASHLDESMAFLMIDLIRRFLGANWTPAWVTLASASDTGSSALEQIYGTSVVFRSEGAGIALRPHELEAPNPNGRSLGKTMLLRDIPTLLGVVVPTCFSETVVEVLRFQVVLGDISQDTVAERLSLGVQTLQRRLRREGTSFREIRNAFLKQRAADLLTQTDHSIEEIARSLGYEETNSFRRAFRTWFGLSPTEFSRNGPSLAL